MCYICKYEWQDTIAGDVYLETTINGNPKQTIILWVLLEPKFGPLNIIYLFILHTLVHVVICVSLNPLVTLIIININKHSDNKLS